MVPLRLASAACALLAVTDAADAPGPRTADVSDRQRDLVALLSGRSPHDGAPRLAARGSAAERRAAADLLAAELERPTPELEQLYRRHASARSIPLERTGTGSTDHEAFRNAGFPAVGVTGELTSGERPPHYHTPGDTLDTVDFGFLASTSGLVLDVLTELAEER